MDSSTPCGYSASDYYSSNLSYTKHSDCTRDTGDSAQEDVNSRSVKRNDNVTVEELEITLDQTLNMQPIQEREFGQIPASDTEEIHKCGALIAKTDKGLTKCATFPCSEKMLASPASVDGRDMTPTTSVDGQSSLRCEIPAYVRSMSMPTPLRIVSAMKGGREQHGAPVKTKLNVKWAPEVYDPPETSLSHTVKSYQRRPKAKKRDHHKHKHNKGKSARGSGSEKKQHTNRRSICSSDPLRLRLSTPGDELLLDDFDKSAVEVVDFAVSSQDTKCGSSFLRASLARMHLSVAEAT